MLSIDIKKRLGNKEFAYKFDLDCKGIIGIFGASGSGKSTLINMISGLITPDEGVITLDGEVFFDSENRINLKPNKREIGLIFQDSRLFPHLDVLSNIRYGYKSDISSVDFDGLINILGIGELLKRYPRNLSGGEKQRVAIARAILSSPKLILMDEPNASLDDTKKDELLLLYRSLANEFNLPLIYVSHSRYELRMVAKSVVLIDKQRVARIISPSELTEIKTLNRW